MKLIVPKQEDILLPINNSDLFFPVGRVFCVGRNYAEHAKEMGDDPDRDPPFFFLKSASCVVPASFERQTFISYPMCTSQFEYEVELVVVLGKGGFNLSRAQACDAVLGYAVGLDMTRRDLQTEAKKKGRPWEVGKSFDQSAPISPIVLKNDDLAIDMANAEIGLKLNGRTMQISRTSNLTWSVEDIIAQLSQSFELRAGDVIMTGTPENVGAVNVGGNMLAWVDGLGAIEVSVTD